MRVVVLGGHGNFGARICRTLDRDAMHEVVAAGRNPATSRVPPGFSGRIRSARLDASSPGFADGLAALKPELVIHCAGPFQGQQYHVAQACIAARSHYVDLADGRSFVAGFAGALDVAAREAGVLALSGASSVPALSSAVVDALQPRFRRIRAIRIAIAPAQRAPRGAATLAGVFSYAGCAFSWLRDGAWVTTHGWQDLTRLRFAGLGTRWAAACDVPDLALFPQRYGGVETVEFRAALEVGLQHLALWLVAALRRAGLPLPVERWAPTLDRLASLMDHLGTQRGGMRVAVTGVRSDGRPGTSAWHLTADASHGPEIPCMAAVLLARKLARGDVTRRGAHACMGFLTLDEFMPEFARWGMIAQIEEAPA